MTKKQRKFFSDASKKGWETTRRKMTEEELKKRFSDMGKASAEARRQRKEQEKKVERNP